MSALLTVCLGLALIQDVGQDLESPPAVDVAPAPPSEEPPPAPVPVVPGSSAHARRASSAPVTAATNNTVLRRVVGGLSAGAGVFLVGAGILAAGFVAFVEYSNWPASPKAAEYPRHTVSVVGAATAAVCLMFGAAAVLGGLAALL